MKYWAFISYSSTDSRWARWLRRSIENYGIPAKLLNHATPAGDAAPKRLRPVFRDRDELPASAHLGGAIEEALAQSRYLVVVCSPRAATSQWVNKEIATFRALGRQDRIFAVIVDGTPHTGDESECFPEELRKCEPLAADARPSADGLTNAKLKLLAGMLGVGFDDLKQRDTARISRLWRFVATAAVLLATACASVAYYTNTQRVAAITATKESERLLGFLLLDLRDKLAPLGRLDLMEDVERAVDEYYQRMGFRADKARQLMLRTVALESKGRRLALQGDLVGAMQLYQEKLVLSESLLAMEPSNAEFKYNLAVTHGHIGQAQQGMGRFDAALSSFTQEADIESTLLTANPKPEWQVGHASTCASLGNLYRLRSDPEQSLVWHRKGLQLCKLIVAADPNNKEALSLVGDFHSYIGDVNRDQGALEEALASYIIDRDIQVRAAAAEPRDTDRQYCIAASSRKVGIAYRLIGAINDAEASCHVAREILERLVKQDASNIGWQRELSVVLGDLGDLSLDRGDYDNASDYLTRSCLIAEKVASLKPMDCGCRSDWVRAIVAVGDMEDARGRSDEARTAYERATSIAEQHTEEESLSTSLKDRELVLERLALVLQRTDLDASLAIHRRRLSVAEQYASLEPLAEDAQRDLALAHKNIGRALQLKGDTQGAMCSFVSSLDIAERLYRKNSAAVVNQAVLSDSHERIAEIQSLRGNYDAAIESCRHCVAIRKTLAAIDPSNVQAQRGLAISYGRFGRALMEKGTFDAAREAFQDGVAIREQLTAQNPNDLKRLGELGIGYREIGDAEEQLGNHVTAMGYQEKAAAIAAKCAESDDTLDNLHLLASSCQRMGSMCCLQGRLDTGIDWHRRCVSALEKSIARDNSRSSTKEAIALAYQFLGDALVSQGNQHEARANYVKSQQVFEKLVATDRTNVVWQENLVGALMRVGLSFKWDEKLTEAVKSLEDAAALGDQLLKGSTGQVALRMDAAARHFYLFELYSRKEQPSKAAVHLRRYRQRLVELKQCGERVDGGFDLDKKLWDVTKMIPDDSRVDEWISGELFTKTLARCSRGHRRPDGADSRETE